MREYLCIIQLTNPDISLQDIATAVSKIEPEKSSKVQEAKNFLVSNPSCASAPQLHSKVDEANKKYTKIEQLLQCSQEKYGTWAIFLLFFCVCFWIAFKSGFKSSALNDMHFNSNNSNNCIQLCFRLKNSNQLETSLQNGKTLLSGYENKLAREEVAPADITSLEKTQRELAVRWLFYSLALITMISRSD